MLLSVTAFCICSWGCAAPAITTPPTAARAAAPTPFTQALARALLEPAAGASLRLFAECATDAGLASVELFGSGIGIANGRRQFEAPPAVLTAALMALHDFEFAAMPETFGGQAGDPGRPARPATVAAAHTGNPAAGPAGPLRVTCRVEATLDGLSHSVLQLAKGFQSPALRRLALDLLRLCDQPARSGIEATDLADGLAKLAGGRLAPEALRLMLHRRPARSEIEGGFLLRVEGLRATASTFDPASGYGETHELRLTADDLATLAGNLARAEVGQLPVNLWSAIYTDLTVTVLDHRSSIQARRFADMSPSTHGASQHAFDNLQAELTELAGRLLAEGRITPPGE